MGQGKQPLTPPQNTNPAHLCRLIVPRAESCLLLPYHGWEPSARLWAEQAEGCFAEGHGPAWLVANTQRRLSHFCHDHLCLLQPGWVPLKDELITPSSLFPISKAKSQPDFRPITLQEQDPLRCLSPPPMPSSAHSDAEMTLPSQPTLLELHAGFPSPVLMSPEVHGVSTGPVMMVGWPSIPVFWERT